MTKPGKVSKESTWRKSPARLVDLFAAVLPEEPDIEKRQMFGYPCAFVNGNMFTGLHQESLIVRLAEEDRLRLVNEDGAAQFEPMPGRIMKEYVSLPDAILDNRSRLTQIVASSKDYAASLPPKVKKPRNRKAGPR